MKMEWRLGQMRLQSLSSDIKKDLNSNQLDYRVSRTIITPQVQSNYYLVHAGFAMNEKNGGMNPVQRFRLAHRITHNWHNKEFGYQWKMNDNSRQEALSKCGINQ